MKRRQTSNRIGKWAIALIAVSVSMTGATAHGQNNVQNGKVYIKMDYWKAVGSQSAEAWHFDPNNNNQWTQLSNDTNPNLPDLRPRALFEVGDLFDENLLLDDHIWFVEVFNIDVVRGDPGSFQSVGNIPAYSQMIDLMAMKLDGTASSMTPQDPCGNRIWPIATGSERTPYRLFEHDRRDPGGYGMRMVKWELLGSAAWRWKNPADVVEGEDVYIEFTLRFDLVDMPQDPEDRHINVYVSWVSAGGGCGYNFCLPEGLTSKSGSLFDPGSNAKIVVAVPHIMDHGTGISLSWTRGVNVHEIVSKVPNNSINHPAAHLCEPDGDENTWHTHSSGQTRHLQVGGLSQHHDGLWLDRNLGDKLVAIAGFDIPQHSVEAPINSRALWMVFWHPPGGAQ